MISKITKMVEELKEYLGEEELMETIYPNDIKLDGVTVVKDKTIKIGDGSIRIIAAYRDFGDDGLIGILASVTTTTTARRQGSVGAILASENFKTVDKAEAFLKKYRF